MENKKKKMSSSNEYDDRSVSKPEIRIGNSSVISPNRRKKTKKKQTRHFFVLFFSLSPSQCTARGQKKNSSIRFFAMLFLVFAFIRQRRTVAITFSPAFLLRRSTNGRQLFVCALNLTKWARTTEMCESTLLLPSTSLCTVYLYIPFSRAIVL